MKKVTIYDLARRAGASPSTVSACLNGTWRRRRIKEETARRLQRLAAREGYQANLQARGLRQSRSGLIGLLLPIYEDRFFASLAQCFDTEARRRGLCPITVSTHRDPAEEQRTVETLIAYAVDTVFVAGATDPNVITDVCRNAGLNTINIDLPGTRAPSVISDNLGGAVALTEAIFDAHPDNDSSLSGRIYFIGGRDTDFATKERIAGFCKVVGDRNGSCEPRQIIATGYSPDVVAGNVAKLFAAKSEPPLALFVNSTVAFEGVVGFLSSLPPNITAKLVVGCFDYDPFVRHLRFPIIMLRQEVGELVREAFMLMDNPPDDPRSNSTIIRVAPTLIMPGER